MKYFFHLPDIFIKNHGPDKSGKPRRLSTDVDGHSVIWLSLFFIQNWTRKFPKADYPVDAKKWLFWGRNTGVMQLKITDV